MVESIQAYDVHAETDSGHYHFQVLVKKDADEEDVEKYAKSHLELCGDPAKEDSMKIEKIGHTQGPQGNQTEVIADTGYAIYKVHPTT